MSKKIIQVTLVLSCLMFFVMPELCFAGWEPTLLNQARDYMRMEDYYRAETMYKTVLTDSPGTSKDFRARTNLVVIYINQERYGEAQEILDKLIEDFSERSALPGAFYRIAKRYARSGKYEKAKSVFELITQRYPDSSEVEGAQDHVRRVNVLSLIQLGNYTAAQQALDKLVVDFSGHRSLPKMLFDIAREYQASEKYEEAKGVCQTILANYQGTGEASAAQQQLVFLYLEGYGQVQEAIDKLVADFSEEPDFSGLLYTAARNWEALEKYEGAKTIYQEIIKRCPGSSHADVARLDISRLNIYILIDSGSDTAVREALDKLVADFSGHSSLPDTVSWIANRYRAKALALQKEEGLSNVAKDYFEKAVAIWEMAINKFPGDRNTPDTYCCAGDCYHALGEYEKSLGCWQKVVKDWPDYVYHWYALFMVGINYEDLAQSGLVSKSQAEAEIKAAYQQLLEKYPACPVAKNAKFWLANHGSE